MERRRRLVFNDWGVLIFIALAVILPLLAILVGLSKGAM